MARTIAFIHIAMPIPKQGFVINLCEERSLRFDISKNDLKFEAGRTASQGAIEKHVDFRGLGESVSYEIT